MLVACSNCHDVRPLAHIALSVVVFSHGNHRTVGFQSYRVVGACGDCLAHGNFIPKGKGFFVSIHKVAHISIGDGSFGDFSVLLIFLRVLIHHKRTNEKDNR